MRARVCSPAIGAGRRARGVPAGRSAAPAGRRRPRARPVAATGRRPAADGDEATGAGEGAARGAPAPTEDVGSRTRSGRRRWALRVGWLAVVGGAGEPVGPNRHGRRALIRSCTLLGERFVFSAYLLLLIYFSAGALFSARYLLAYRPRRRMGTGNFAYFGSAAFVPGHAAEVGVVFPARRLRHGVSSPGPRVPDSHERNSPSAPLLWRGGEEHPMNDTVRFLRVVSLPAGRRLRPKPRVPGKAKTAPRAETPQRRRRASNRTRCSMTSPQLRSQSHSRDMVT